MGQCKWSTKSQWEENGVVSFTHREYMIIKQY
jgi:hypothetical protein